MKNQKLSWEEMKRNYPEEWLLIVDYELNERGDITTGVVLRHSASKDDVYLPLASPQNTAFRYTGESSFSGLRSHAAHHHPL
ncbi:MAG TPA: hypothetical protein DF383_09995 [Deltaproteobacteria bacterium]|nr:hypothetical protein [Deltaproteobacteria bacterium]